MVLDLTDARRHDRAPGGHVLQQLEWRVVEQVELCVRRHRDIHRPQIGGDIIVRHHPDEADSSRQILLQSAELAGLWTVADDHQVKAWIVGQLAKRPHQRVDVMPGLETTDEADHEPVVQTLTARLTLRRAALDVDTLDSAARRTT